MGGHGHGPTQNFYATLGVGADGKRLLAARQARAGSDLGAPLFRAISRNPAHASRHGGIYGGATPIAEFFSPLNLARIMIEDSLRGARPRTSASALGLA